jgi:hypothetical protein
MPDIKRKPRIDTPATDIKKDPKGKGRGNVLYKVGEQDVKVGIDHLKWKTNFYDRKIAKYQAIEDEATDPAKKEAKRLRKRYEKYQKFYKKIVDEYNAIGQT